MIRSVLFVSLICVSFQTVRADDEARRLSMHLPPGANSVSVIHFDEILNSQKGNRENWTASQKELFEEGRSGLPPWLETLVVGSLVRPSVPEEVWAAGVFELPSDVSFADLVKKANASVVSLDGRPGFVGTTGAFFVKLDDEKIAAHRPGHRQEVLTWLRRMNPNADSLSSYLRDAVAMEDQIVMSIDLRGMFDSEYVKDYLEHDERFAAQRQLIPKLIPLLSGLKGVTMTINIQEEANCDVWIDFSEEVGPSAAIAKTLFLTAMEDAGAGIEEFSEAKITPLGQRVRLRCTLSNSSLQRILSLIVPPRVSHQDVTPQLAKEDESEPPTEEKQAAERQRATERYVDGVADLVADLRKASRNIKSYQKTIAWHQTYANKIDRLPTKNVPDEILSLGDEIAQKFRALARSLQGQAVQIDARNRSVTYQYDYNPGWFNVNIWGGAGYRPASVNVKSNLQEVRQKQAEAVISGEKERRQIWAMINQDLTEMKRLTNVEG